MGSPKQIAPSERFMPLVNRVLLTLAQVRADQAVSYDGVAVEHTQVT